ncbi:MAG TPA: ABC transporter permease [Verrucomicrobiota bacterium]|nr:ABC transporter permease [Verrucomicrobiota bacterium]
MNTIDLFRLAWQSLWYHRQRSVLTMLGILIGITSVILLTSIGEGTRNFVLSEFTQFGTTLVAINPGRIETTGIPGALGTTVHPLTLEDAEALNRLPGITRVVPVIMGSAPVEQGGKTRNVFVYGVTAAMPDVWRIRVRAGRFLPALDVHDGAPVAVLGPTLKRELFGDQNCLGRHVRIAGERFLVIGLMESKGQFLGIDIDDSAYVHVAQARHLFNRDNLHEIDLTVANASIIDPVVSRVKRTLIARHNREEDFTVTTQNGMLETLDRIIRIVSLAVVGIGAISLLVGAVGILTMMWISVNERTSEIGLARAIGATSRQILLLFLIEASLVSTLGGILGLAIGLGFGHLLHLYVPALPVKTPAEYVVLALAVSLLVGLVSGLLPARRAANLDPVVALTAD